MWQTISDAPAMPGEEGGVVRATVISEWPQYL